MPWAQPQPDAHTLAGPSPAPPTQPGSPDLPQVQAWLAAVVPVIGNS